MKLTDEQIDAICAPLGFEQLSPRAVARAIEEALAEQAAALRKAIVRAEHGMSYGNALAEQARPVAVTDDMVSRFLCWRLPDDFAPDCGISFTKLSYPNSSPTGTNLLSATQARQMLEYVLAAVPKEDK